MANPATIEDVQARWRSLSDTEQTVAETRLDDAWRKLKRDVSDLETRLVGSDDLRDDTVRVLSDAVIRVLQSAERGGLRKGAVGVDDGTASWELDASIRTGLYFTNEELGDLAPTGQRRPRAYSVQPT